MDFKEGSISKLGGMARVEEMNDFYGCPPWLDINQWQKYREDYRLASQGMAKLLQLDLELSDNCNYKCIECPISDDSRLTDVNSLPFEQVEQVMIEGYRAGARALKLNYINEPLLDIEKLLSAAKSAQSIGYLDIYFTTNGSLLSEHNIVKLLECKLFTRIQVSLDAFTAETYKLVRRGGNLDLVKKNINHFILKRSGLGLAWPKIRVSFLALPENLSEEEPFYNYWKDKVDAIALQSSVIKPNSERTNIDRFSMNDNKFCPNPFRQLVVRANGEILPCCSFWGTQLSLGNINHHSETLGYIFENSDINEIRNTFVDHEYGLRDACKRCLSSCDPFLV